MKHQFQHSNFSSLILNLLLLVSSITLPVTTYAATVNLATVPLATATTSSVLPNVMLILDDSGSMASNYLPDWANDSICKSTSGSYNGSCGNQPPFRSPDFNGVYYNPAIRYKPAMNADGTSKQSQTTWTSVKNDAYNIQSTGSTNLVTSYTDVEWCTDSTNTDCLRNDNYILPGTVNSKAYTTSHSSVKSTGSGSMATGSPLAPTTATRSWGPHYYTIIPGEYCDSAKLTNCQLTQTATFSYPAKVRWCNSSANSTAAQPAAGACQATRLTGSFTNVRYPTKFFQPAVAANPGQPYIAPTAAVAPANGSFTINGVNGKSKTISATKCGGVAVTSSANFTSANSNTVATQLDSLIPKINGTANGYTITCSQVGSPTTSLSCVVSVAVAGVSACSGGLTPDSDLNVTNNIGPAGGANYSAGQPYIAPTSAQAASYPGSFVRTDIIPSVTSYPKAISRTDCAGSTCTYTDEMTNFANWWTYYQTRIQSIKTAASLAFSVIDSRYRVGYTSINNNTGSDFLNIDTFGATQKTNWYAKFFAAQANNSTPLRTALTKVGQLYAGKLKNTTYHGATANDPMQYSCQQNFTILSTDGYWNSDTASDVQGVTGSSIGDMDGGSTPRPMNEGPTASSASLADAAKYYYDTDLRDSSFSNCSGALGLDVCENNVFVSGTDNNVKQHMTTFTMGLGVDGALHYTSDYKDATSGDYYDLKNGYGTPTVYWPVPVANTESAVDDLWHAAVNGQGTYFSAKDPAQMTQGLSDALSAIDSKVGAGAAAATSTLNPVAGDNFAYAASYQTVQWTGNLEARTIDLTSGAVSTAATWCVEDVVTTPCAAPSSIVTMNSGANYYCVTPSATSCSSPSVWGDGTNIPATSCALEVPKACAGTLRAKVQTTSDTRTIWMNKSGSLASFTYSNLSATQQTNFKSTFLSSNLSQWTSLDPTTQQSNASQDNLVNYLRGQKGFENSTSNLAVNRLFRYRAAVMGDALESAPVFVGKPNFSYLDTGYDAFKVATARTNTVYIGTNDGMLHAFNAVDGTERWAYVPSMVIPNMWKLADDNYSTMHTNYVNGSTTVSDICVSPCTSASDWRTILVGGLNGGGKGFYALDVTGDTPKLLWEFDTTNDNDMGYSFGNPVVTKKADGTWVVLLTSGYNNTTGSNAGKGILYVLDANNGPKVSITKFSTGVGDGVTPSGLAKINAWIESANQNNQATYIYAGDLLGNVWRFDMNAASAIGTNPFLIATLKDSKGNLQPITTIPELGSIDNNRVVFVGTGKYLEVSDLIDTQQQTIYAIKDTGATFNNARNSLTQQILTPAGAKRTAPFTTTDYFASGNGWYVDLPDVGERQNVSASLVLGTLVVPTTVPSSTVCAPGGYGWVNYLNYKTGGAVDSTMMVSTKTNAPPVGINTVYFNGKPVVSVTTSNNPTPTLVSDVKFNSSSSSFSSQRAIWRELID